MQVKLCCLIFPNCIIPCLKSCFFLSHTPIHYFLLSLNLPALRPVSVSPSICFLIFCFYPIHPSNILKATFTQLPFYITPRKYLWSLAFNNSFAMPGQGGGGGWKQSVFIGHIPLGRNVPLKKRNTRESCCLKKKKKDREWERDNWAVVF